MLNFFDFFLRHCDHNDLETLNRIKALILSLFTCLLMTITGFVLQLIHFNSYYICVLIFSLISIIFVFLLIKNNYYVIANHIFNIEVIIIITCLQLAVNKGAHFDLYRHTASLLFGLFIINLVSSHIIHSIIYSLSGLLSFFIIAVHNYMFFKMPLDEKFIEVIIGSSMLLIVSDIASIFNMNIVEERVKNVREMNKKLEKLNQDKTNITHILSHELKSPISCVFSMANVINQYMRKYSNPQNEELVNTSIYISDKVNIIIEECNRLLKLINNYLNFSMMESNANPLKLEKVSICDIILQNQTIFLPKLNNKNVKFVNEFESKVPKILCDKEKISQVIINIIANAIKFTESGYIKFVVTTDKKNLNTTIEDTGCGISDKYIDMIFNKFNKIPHDKSIERGTGLGLSICKEIVQQHNGTISATSKINKGTTITFSLPI